MNLSIKPAQTIEDFKAIERLQAEIWGVTEQTVPRYLLLTIAKEGGVVVIAKDQGDPIGFAYGFLGLTDSGELKLASHQAGVLPAYQDRGLGYKIKLAQRETTLARNITLMTWTFDPLQGRNARFNLRKLGAICRTYLPNLYGEMTDALNQGLPSDRFSAEWRLESPHVLRRLAGHEAEPDPASSGWPILNSAQRLENGLEAPSASIEQSSGTHCLVEIPEDINRLKAEAPDLALQWRLQTRSIFQNAFEAGYTATDFLRQGGHNYYLLQKNWELT